MNKLLAIELSFSYIKFKLIYNEIKSIPKQQPNYEWRDKKNNEARFSKSDSSRFKILSPIQNGLIVNPKLQIEIISHNLNLYLSNKEISQSISILKELNVVLIASHLNSDSSIEELTNQFYQELKVVSLNRICQLTCLHQFISQETASFRIQTQQDANIDEDCEIEVDIKDFVDTELKKPRLILDIGATQISSGVIYDSLVMKRSFKRIPIGAYHLISYLGDFVSKNSYKIDGDQDLCEKLFIETSQVTNDIQNEIIKQGNEKYNKEYDKFLILSNKSVSILTQEDVVANEAEMNDSQTSKVKVGIERFYVPEALFKPQLINFKWKGIVGLLKESLDTCNEKLMFHLTDNIQIQGGLTKLDNLYDRMQKELRRELDQDFNLCLFQVQNENSIIDGAIQWMQKVGPETAITHEEYDALGYDQFKFKNIY